LQSIQDAAVAVAEFDCDVFKQGLGAELHGDICSAHGATKVELPNPKA
jgi:hypothetical protein